MSKQPQINQVLESAMRHHRAGEFDLAVALYRDILEMDARDHNASHLLGLVLHQTGHDDEAIPLFRRSIMLQPGNAACHANFAELWRKQGKLDEAIECYQKVLQIAPRDLTIRQLLGEAYTKTDRAGLAMVEFQKIIQTGQALANTWCGIFEAQVQLGHPEEAIEASFRATQIEPDNAAAWHSLARNLMLIGRVRDALGPINRAIQLTPEERILFWWRGWVLLLLGDLENGWVDYESRWDVEELQLKDRRPFPGFIWRGQEIAGKTVFVHMEQGAGDTLQFIRYLPLLTRRAGKVVFETPKEFIPLVRRSIPDVEFWNDGKKFPYDFHVPLLSLPLAFKTTLANLPAKVPYLQADPAAVEGWRARLAALPGLKVGLAWAGKPSHKNDHHRSIKLNRLLALGNVPGVRLVSLQKGKAAEQIAQSPSLNLLDWTAELNTYDETAALIDALDLIISVDTSVAHLAGALGKPVWTLIPFAPDFRWMVNRDDSPWYPTMRLFRQPAFLNWDGAIDAVAQELSRWTARMRQDRRDHESIERSSIT